MNPRLEELINRLQAPGCPNHALSASEFAELCDAVQDLDRLLGNGILPIALERQRQIEVKGYLPEHDDEHIHGDLAVAAAALAVHGTDASIDDALRDDDFWGLIRKNKDNRLRRLQIAGALIAAEYQREERRNAH